MLAIGSLVAFVVALLAIRFFITYLQKPWIQIIRILQDSCRNRDYFP